MKRILPFLFALSLLCACAKPPPQENPTYAFYYPQKQITYCSETGVLASEARSFPVGLEFKKILNLYLEGPVSESLRTPFPKGLGILELHCEDSTATLLLSHDIL